MPQILKINPLQPENKLIHEAVALLRAGKVVAFPTETFYGLAADASNTDAVDRIFRIKGRSFRSPIALITGSNIGIHSLITEIPATAQRLMQAFWPGPLTLLFAASPQINTRLTAGTGKIGIRVSSHLIADSIANGLGVPITATSANLSGAAECTTVGEVLASLGNRIDLVIDGGPTPGGKGSTFLDITVDPPACLREGAIPFTLIMLSLNTL
jgi:L-threonylcarbamoyladenylate synthase